MKKTFYNLKNGLALALRIIFSLAVIALIIWKFKDLQNIDVRKIIENSSSLIAACGAVLGVYLIKGLTLVVPASLVYIAVGMSMKLPVALTVNIIGIIIEISATYLMGVILGGKFVTQKIKGLKSGEKILSIYEKHEKSGIFLIRIIGFPIDFCSLFFGAMRVRYLPYLGMSLAGILPRVILFTILGDKVYDLIPMRVVVPVALGIVVLLLIAWVVKSAVKAAKSVEAFGKPAYVPICEQRRNIILDTDITTDCDDAGAMAVMFQLLRRYNVKLLGVCNSTSDPYANAVIKAICEYYGYENVPVGQHKGTPIMPDNSKYTRQVTSKYCRYEASAISASSETDFYNDILSSAEDGSVTVISIGMFSNLSAALNNNADLFNRKVHSVVSMAGKFPEGTEFNVTSDTLSAINFLDKYKGMVVFSDYNVGKDIKTGFYEQETSNPVFDCYALHCGGSLPYLNSSFDLTAVQYAFEGNGGFYGLSKPMSVTVDSQGCMTAKKDKYSNRYFIIKNASEEEIENYLNIILKTKPVTGITAAGAERREENAGTDNI